MAETEETKAFYALPAEIRERAEELAGPIREMTRIEVLLAIGKALQKTQQLKMAVEFTARWAWREDPPNANRNLTDTERLSAIKYHPTIKATWERGE
jgi:hypothetical protein